LKLRGITSMLVSLTHGSTELEATDTAISSLVDTWLLVKAIETNGERTRGIYVLKSRGMNHSNQIREFSITSKGVVLLPPYIGPEGVLTGTARAIQEAREATSVRAREVERQRAARLLQRKRALLEQRIAELRAEFEAEEAELLATAADTASVESDLSAMRTRMSLMRGGSQNGQARRRAARQES
jgi:circadian clock protein KaiC